MGRILYPDYFPNRCGPYDEIPRWWLSTLTGYMRMIWRVKKWELIINITNACVTRVDCADINGDHTFTYKSEAGTEEELVCGKGLVLESADTRFDFEYYTFNIFPGFLSFESFSPYSEATAQAIDEGQDKGISLGNNPIPDGPGYQNWIKNTSTVNIENFGIDVAYALFTNFTEIYENEDRNFYYTARVRAKEYWSYGDKYNTQTGEPK